MEKVLCWRRRVLLAMLVQAGSAVADQNSVPEGGWWSQQLRQFHAYGHLDRAYSLISQNRLEEARQQLKHYLELKPEDTEAQARYVDLCSQLHDYEEVIRVANVVLQRDPEQQRVRLQRAVAREKARDPVGAMDDYAIVARNASVPHADREFALDSLAHLAVNAEKYSLALQALDELAGQTPGYEVLLRKAKVLERLDRSAEAAAIYEEALARASANSQRLVVLLALGSLFASEHKWDQADHYFHAAYELEPHNKILLLQLAETAFAKGDYPKAVHWSDEYLRLGPDRRAQELRAQALLADKDFAGATAPLQQLVLDSRTRAERQHNALLLSEAYFDQGNFYGTVRWAREANRLGSSRHGRELLGKGLFEIGEYDAALGYLEPLLQDESTPSGRFDLYWLIGRAYRQLGRHQRAARSFEKAARMDPTPNSTLAQVDALYRAGLRSDLVPVYRSLLTRADISPSTREHLLAQLGYIYSEVGKRDAAADSFRRVLEITPENAQARLALAITLYQQEKTAQALGEFTTVVAQTESAEAALYAGLCYSKLGKPGLALHYLERMLPQAGRLETSALLVLNDELARLYAEAFEYRHAADAVGRALALEYLPERIIFLARMERLAGRPEEAITLLDALDESSSDRQTRSRRWDELASAFAAARRYPDALAALRKAAEAGTIPDLDYRTGILYQHLNDPQQSRQYLEAAAREDPDNSSFAISLGYLYLDQQAYAQAAREFERALNQDPDHVALHAQLGYTYQKLNDNPRAATEFRRAIDAAPFVYGDESTLQLAVESWRQEVSKLENRFDFEGYQVMQQSADADAARTGLLGVGYAPSQGGIVMSYQPAGIGFRDERVLNFTGRVLWQSEAGSQRIDGQSVQGGLGVRYKPLPHHNAFLSLERRFKIGDNARSDWLLRAMYSHNDGLRLPPGALRGRYRSLYLDGAAALSSDKLGSYYLEFRQGFTRLGSGKVLFSPYALAEAYGQTVAGDADNIANVGVGLSARRFFGGNYYKAASSNFDVNLQYKLALTDHESGWSASFILRF